VLPPPSLSPPTGPIGGISERNTTPTETDLYFEFPTTVREKKRTNHYDPSKEAAKPQWKKPKKAKDQKPKEPNGVHTYFISSDEDEA
jgi:hypothetical protein